MTRKLKVQHGSSKCHDRVDGNLEQHVAAITFPILHLTCADACVAHRHLVPCILDTMAITKFIVPVVAMATAALGTSHQHKQQPSSVPSVLRASLQTFHILEVDELTVRSNSAIGMQHVRHPDGHGCRRCIGTGVVHYVQRICVDSDRSYCCSRW